MDINRELTELIHQYHIDEYYPFFYQSCRAEQLAKSIYESLGDVILAGTAQTDIRWFRKVACGRDTAAVLLEREDGGEQLRKYEGFKGVFLVVSYYGRDEAMVRLLEAGLHAVCLYEEFEKEGLSLNGSCYDVYREEYSDMVSGEPTRDFEMFDINQIFFLHRRSFELALDPDSRKTALQKMIFDCAYARDFLTLKSCIDRFREQFGGGGQYSLFYEEVEGLLSRMKAALAGRGKQDCVMFWLDYLVYGDDADMPFVRSLDEQSLVFSNLYTVTAVTSATIKPIFLKKRVLEEEAYKIEQIDRENSRLLVELEQRGYRLQYYGGDWGLNRRYADVYRARHYYSWRTDFPQMYWDMLGDILMGQTEEAFFCILHELNQTHPPYISMGLTGNTYAGQINADVINASSVEKVYGSQIAESRAYVDRQLAFYGSLLPDKMLKMYMSDHGHTWLKSFHCILKVSRADIRPGVCTDLLSWYDADRLILGLVDGRPTDYTDIQNEYVLVQDTPYYNKDIILAGLKRKEIPSWISERYDFQGVVTKQDLFIRCGAGMEFYQKLRNDGIMVTDERLDYLRGITSRKRADLSDEKFRYSRLYLQAMERCRVRTAQRQEEKCRIIRNIFAGIPDGEVLAIRGGGMPSLRLLMLLDESSRKKARYVLDADPECYAGKMGIQVISPEMADRFRIDKVLLVSLEHRREWKAECQSRLKAEVVDLYDVLEEQGIECRKEFYSLEYAEEDFEGLEI